MYIRNESTSSGHTSLMGEYGATESSSPWHLPFFNNCENCQGSGIHPSLLHSLSCTFPGRVSLWGVHRGSKKCLQRTEKRLHPLQPFVREMVKIVSERIPALYFILCIFTACGCLKKVMLWRTNSKLLFSIIFWIRIFPNLQKNIKHGMEKATCRIETLTESWTVSDDTCQWG